MKISPHHFLYHELFVVCSLLAVACGVETKPVAVDSGSVAAEPGVADTPVAPTQPATTQPTTVEAKTPVPTSATETQRPVADAPRPLTDEELTAGWISLFDGETLFGWQPRTDANWRVEAGAIVVDDGTKGLLTTTTRFADYVLKIEFRSAVGTNSGIFL
ncbi:MAG: DUF1080 domain-containing protein, partial [Pirellulaceae bacterium]|nr:DUF1080 domain-containing protein [Pirellulaceae bacterium]